MNYKVMNYANRYIIAAIGIIVVIIIYYLFTQNNSPPVPFDCTKCAPYACNDDKKSCKTQCTGTGDCVAATCTNNICVPFDCTKCSPYSCNDDKKSCRANMYVR